MVDNTAMQHDTDPMQEYFAKLGLEPEIADIYTALRMYGPQSLLQLARNAKIERTRIYRLLDSLTDCHLVEIQEEYKRKIYKAAPISNLQILLSKREQDVQDLKKQLTELQDTYTPTSASSPLTHVQFYRGQEGVKQMLWNQTKAQSESLSILFENMQNKTSLTFFERWVARCNEQNLQFRSIAGDHFLETQRNWYAVNDNEKLTNWQGRYLPDDVFPITHSSVMYDDVVAYYNWKGDEVFGLEIHNQEIATTQRSLFEMLWQQGQPIPAHGEK
jgi:sugar-specific transcriptional regulator TrmB